MAIGEITQNAAGRDGGELLIVADEAHAGPARQRVGDHGVEVQRGGHAGFVDDEQGARVDGVEPVSGRVIGGRGLPAARLCELHEFGDGVGGSVQILAQDFGRPGGGGEPDDVAAGVAPRGGQGGHRGGFAGACRG